MTVAVELDADPPRLRRADGLIVQFPPDETGGYPVIEVGWLRPDGFELLFRWHGLTYQELQPGDNAALLVGHVPKGGYSSAVVSITEDGVALEFADRVAMKEPRQSITVALTLDIGVRLETTTDAAVHVDEELLAPAFIHRRMVIDRAASTKPLIHRHCVRIPLSLIGPTP